MGAAEDNEIDFLSAAVPKAVTNYKASNCSSVTGYKNDRMFP